MVTKRHLRIAVLECDEPVGKTKEKYGGYGNLFKELLQNGLERYPDLYHEKAPELEVAKFDVVNTDQYPRLEDVDAILLTGSKHNSFDNDPWILRLVDFTRNVLAQDRVRLIGVCFGHQIIGRAMDVKVARSEVGWEVAVVPVELTGKGKELFQLDTMHIHQMHRDIVTVYPPHVQHLGHTDRCAVQGMYVPQRVITVQGHPEFDGDIVAELLERRHEQGIFDDVMYEEGMSRVRREHDGVRIGSAFVRFCMEE